MSEDVINRLRDAIRDQNHDLCGYESKDQTIIRLRRQRRELARLATEVLALATLNQEETPV